jgi:hypothetical protein
LLLVLRLSDTLFDSPARMVKAYLSPIAIDDKDQELELEHGKPSSPSSETLDRLPAHEGEARNDPAKCEPSRSTELLVDIPPNGGYGWVCVAACFFINAHTWGMNSVSGLPQQEMVQHSYLTLILTHSHSVFFWRTISPTIISRELLAFSTPSLLAFP